MKIIKIIVREVYGREIFYPGCEFSKMLCELLNQKSISQTDLDVLIKNSYKVERSAYLKEPV